MNPELATILANIQSLVEQVKQMSGGESDNMDMKKEGDKISPDEIAKILKELEGSPEDKKEDEDENVKKAIAPAKEESPDKGTTASDDAKENIEDVGDVNEKNLKEVAKAIMSHMRKSKVEKSQDVNKELINAIKLIVDEQSEIKKGLENIYEGLGIATEIKKLNEVKKSEDATRLPNDPTEIKKSIDEIKRMLGTKEESQSDKNHSLQKSLIANDGELLSGIFQMNNKR